MSWQRVAPVNSSVGSGRSLVLQKQREKAKESHDELKNQIEGKRRKIVTVGEQFGISKQDILEEAFKNQTVGLTTRKEFQERREVLSRLIDEVDGLEASELKTKEKKTKSNLMSFGESSEEEQPVFIKKIKKNPTVDTSFLKDEEREKQALEEKALLIQEYEEREAKEKSKLIGVDYSYWDGSGHRRKVEIAQGCRIGDFLKIAAKDLTKEFYELRNIPSENLLFVKEDLILPHNITFYQLVRDKVQGKCGALFRFEAEPGMGLIDIQNRVESHPAKIVEKKWYDRHKHIYPASRWENYDPAKTYATFSIAGKAPKK